MLTKAEIDLGKRYIGNPFAYPNAKSYLLKICDQAILTIELQAEIDSLRSQMRTEPWILVSERLPTPENGDINGDVLVWYKSMDVVCTQSWSEVHNRKAYYWMVIPKLPSRNGD